jgi:hypothetical protein
MNGQQKGEENVKNLERYLETLRRSGKRLPTYRGDLNKSTVAEILGFDRGVWRDNAKALAILEKAAADPELGIEHAEPNKPAEKEAHDR